MRTFGETQFDLLHDFKCSMLNFCGCVAPIHCELVKGRFAGFEAPLSPFFVHILPGEIIADVDTTKILLLILHDRLPLVSTYLLPVTYSNQG